MSIKTVVKVFAWAFGLLGAYVAYDFALGLLNLKSDAAVVAGVATLVALGCVAAIAIVRVYRKFGLRWIRPALKR